MQTTPFIDAITRTDALHGARSLLVCRATRTITLCATVALVLVVVSPRDAMSQAAAGAEDSDEETDDGVDGADDAEDANDANEGATRGPKVRAPTLNDDGHRQSSGAPDLGRLANPTRLRANKRIRLRFPKNVYGSSALISLIDGCTAEVARVHGRSHKLLVGDLSRRSGGLMRPHEGHQNGREADIGFYMRGGVPLAGLWRASSRDIDAGRTLTYLTCMLDSGRVLRVFLDRSLQAPLVAEAQQRGWSAGRIARTFSYPRASHLRVGRIQHRSHHDNHLHVRLRCAPHEVGCIDKPYGRKGREALFAARKGTAKPPSAAIRRAAKRVKKATTRGKRGTVKRRAARTKTIKKRTVKQRKSKRHRVMRRTVKRPTAHRRTVNRRVKEQRMLKRRAAVRRGHRSGGGARRD